MYWIRSVWLGYRLTDCKNPFSSTEVIPLGKVHLHGEDSNILRPCSHPYNVLCWLMIAGVWGCFFPTAGRWFQKLCVIIVILPAAHLAALLSLHCCAALQKSTSRQQQISSLYFLCSAAADMMLSLSLLLCCSLCWAAVFCCEEVPILVPTT